ncbi:MAG TPA: ribonuclease H [Rectinemataceae bacterium]|nr:ribonuclease H [Rectinemataceae bacterium]
MEDIVIYTDGGCSGNPGPGGWAFVYRDGKDRIEGSGGEKATTNNRMELRAVIEALSLVERRSTALRRAEESAGAASAAGSAAASGAGSDGPAAVLVHTDSQYVKNGIGSWIANWKRNGWRTADKKPVKNQELWEALDALASRVKPKFLWVKGHAGVEGNERCDALVQEEIRRLR